MINQDFLKLDKVDGTNFTRWKDKFMFILITLKIYYILNPNLSVLPEPRSDHNDQIIKAEQKNCKEYEVLYRGHILNTLSNNRLHDLLTLIKPS